MLIIRTTLANTEVFFGLKRQLSVLKLFQMKTEKNRTTGFYTLLKIARSFPQASVANRQEPL